MANNGLQKAKGQYAEEVAKIKPLEMFGIDACGVTWYGLIRKHLAFDVLKCGGLDCDGEKCLRNEVEKSCSC